MIFYVYFQALNKKEHKGCESPEMEGDMYSNSLSIEEKYNRMNEEYQRALHHQNQMRVNTPLRLDITMTSQHYMSIRLKRQ